MTTDERQFVVEGLEASEKRLFEVVSGLTAGQWRYRVAAGRWSIAEVLEHLVVWESFMLGAVEGALLRPAEPEKRDLVGGKDSLVLGLAGSRDKPLQARDAAQPTGRWSEPAVALAEYRLRRARTIEFAKDTQADLRSHFFAHIAFGDLDCYQWLVAMGQHTLRHVGQIEEIKRDPAWPAMCSWIDLSV